MPWEISEYLVHLPPKQSLLYGVLAPSRVTCEHGVEVPALPHGERAPQFLWRLLGGRTQSRGPLGTFQMSFDVKNEHVKIRPCFPLKIEPWRTLGDSGPPKKGTHGPDHPSQGPPVVPLGRPTHSSGPSLCPPRISPVPNLKKNCFLLKFAQTCIFIRSGAPRGN